MPPPSPASYVQNGLYLPVESPLCQPCCDSRLNAGELRRPYLVPVPDDHEGPANRTLTLGIPPNLFFKSVLKSKIRIRGNGQQSGTNKTGAATIRQVRLHLRNVPHLKSGPIPDVRKASAIRIRQRPLPTVISTGDFAAGSRGCAIVSFGGSTE